jgi:hypothetical protein
VFGDPGTYTLKGINAQQEIILGSFTISALGWGGVVLNPNNKYYSQFILYSTVTVAITEIELYGLIRRKDNDYIGSFPKVSTLEHLADSRADKNAKGYLTYNSTLTVTNDVFYKTLRQTLSADYSISDDSDVLLYNFNPGGVPRIVYLPQIPKLECYIRITNLDGNFAIAVRESGATSNMLSLSNLAGIKTAEFIWEVATSTWHVTA